MRSFHCAPKASKRPGPTTFVMTEDDYTPSEDLSVLFLEPLKEEN
jgi:hypothetical protein